MTLTRLKRLLALGAAAAGVAGAVAALAAAALVVVHAGTGADPTDAFTPTELIPEPLRGRVTWLEDAPDLDRPMEPTTRTALEAAWLHAAAEREAHSPVSMTTPAHELAVDFYALDGQIVGLTAETVVTAEVGGRPVVVRETYEAVIILTDGRWRIDKLHRIGAILTES
ncbi:MAG: hypothetical protein OEV40_27880 [Acidimicrobiia bacterium]|nr:hypothetical protein [Acidimicrobiia bacterium]